MALQRDVRGERRKRGRQQTASTAWEQSNGKTASQVEWGDFIVCSAQLKLLAMGVRVEQEGNQNYRGSDRNHGEPAGSCLEVGKIRHGYRFLIETVFFGFE